MTTIDTVQICALLNAALDTAGVKVPAFYRRHGVGAEQEANVINMLRASLGSMERAAELAAAHEPTHLAILRYVRKLRSVIEDHQEQYQAWLQVPVLIAMDEAENAVKH